MCLVDLVEFRRNLESSEAWLSATKRARAPGEEPRGERHLHNGKTEFRSVRHDDTSADRIDRQTEAYQEGARCSAVQVGQRPAPDRPSHPGPALPGACGGRPGKCLCSTLRRGL